MHKADEIRLQHMRDAAREAVAFAAGKTHTDMEGDRMRALALVRCLEIIGEAAGTVSPELKAALPHIPWREMTAMRNRLIHAYFSVDLNLVLDTAHSDLPPLIAALNTALPAAVSADDLEEPLQ